MRIARFVSAGTIHHGQVLDDAKSARRIDGDILGKFTVTEQVLPVEKLLAPVVPVDIFCIGLNYREHAAESKSYVPKNPMMFLKSSNTLNNPNDPVRIPKRSEMIDYECELAIVIGKEAKNVTRERALDYVLGYTCANDVSARDWQRDRNLGGGQFCRSKSFDGFCPLGPWIVTADEIGDPQKLRVKTMLNGQVMQDNSTADMIFDVRTLIESLSSTLTLRAGCVILTGTPQGVGAARTPPVFMKDGDRVVVEIEKIGRLENPIPRE